MKKEEPKVDARRNIAWRDNVQTGRRGESVRTNRRLERGAIPVFRSFFCLLPLDFSRGADRVPNSRERERHRVDEGMERAVFGEGGNTLRATERYIYIYIYKYKYI